jgi:hypothetical protein
MYVDSPRIIGPAHVGLTSPWVTSGAYHGGTNTPASAVHPVANSAFFYPMAVPINYTVKRMWWLNGATLAGTVDVGVYKEDGTRAVSAGSTSPTPINSIQFADVADTLLTPGMYYLAISASLGTTTFWRHVLQGIDDGRALGIVQQATAHPLPTTATFAQMASNHLPYFGMTNTT